MICCCIYLTICDKQVLLKYFIDKYYWDILPGFYLCFYFYPIFGKERPHMILRNMSKSVLTVDCFCHPLVMLHMWLEKSRSVMLSHLKNLAASSLAISENGSVWDFLQRLRNVLSQKKAQKTSKMQTLRDPKPAHLQWAQDQGVRSPLRSTLGGSMGQIIGPWK